MAQESVHVVTQGETLGGIANRARVPRVLIAEANGLKPPFDVRPGQKLLIPRTRHYVVKPGDTGFGIAYKQAVPWSQIAVANGLDPRAPVVPGKELLIPTVLDPAIPTATPAAKSAAGIASNAAAVASAAAAAAAAPAGTSGVRFAWPIDGAVRRGWKPRSAADHHDGLDIAAPRGAPVRAAAAGTVVFAGLEKEQFGNLVVVDHGDGWNTAYGFLSRITVKQGAKVAAGERVGLVGDTGRARGNELHFEVRQEGAPIDPTPELPPAP
jgi:murein DD-endopeptidase MepM/ murein hydrolase activator NlpD